MKRSLLKGCIDPVYCPSTAPQPSVQPHLCLLSCVLVTWRITAVWAFCTGRFFDGRLYDVLELGVDKYTSIRDFGRAAEVQIGNKVGRQPKL